MKHGFWIRMKTIVDKNPELQKFMARQPILDRHQLVLGYELLFRSSLDNYFQSPCDEQASQHVVNKYLVMGIETLTGGRKAFINFTRQALLRDYPTLLPCKQVVVEILEDIQPDDDILAACRRLKRAGYTIALDDFSFKKTANPLTAYADIIKVDFRATPPVEREALVRRFSPHGVKMLAEKVETQREAADAQHLGYTYFQGYFFCKPQVFLTSSIPGFKLNYLRILQAINREEVDFREVEEILRQEPSLLYKLLRYLNSAGFALRGQVTSIRHILALLGERNLRKWTSIVAMLDLAGDKPAELVVTSLTRARFCELLARPLDLYKRETDLFLLGLLSVMDAILNRPIEDILAGLPVTKEVKAGLLAANNRFCHVLNAAVALERGDWDGLRDCIDYLEIDEESLQDLYLQAIKWARSIFDR